MKSRRSTTSGRHRNSFINADLTDDEDSDSDPFVDDVRSTRGRRDSNLNRSSHNRRPRKNSTQSNIEYDDDAHESDSILKNRSSVRSNRGGSVARSVQDFPTQSSTSRRPLTNNNDRDRERELARQKLEKLSMSSRDRFERARITTPPKKSTMSDSMTPESEFEFEKPKDYEEKMVDSDIEPRKKPIIEPERAKIEESEDRNNSVEENGAAEEEIGPPPTTPPHEWVCEFCTFVNEANIKICTICCKTPLHVPQKPATKNVVPTVAEGEKKRESSNTTKPVTASTISEDSSEPAKKKGRIRKISFWPGTKTT
jgi:E3 ubiquitin-protein ligase RNF31